MTTRGFRSVLGIIVAAVFAATPVQAAPFAYVTSSFTDVVSVIDTATNTVVASIRSVEANVVYAVATRTHR